MSIINQTNKHALVDRHIEIQADDQGLNLKRFFPSIPSLSAAALEF